MPAYSSTTNAPSSALPNVPIMSLYNHNEDDGWDSDPVHPGRASFTTRSLNRPRAYRSRTYDELYRPAPPNDHLVHSNSFPAQSIRAHSAPSDYPVPADNQHHQNLPNSISRHSISDAAKLPAGSAPPSEIGRKIFVNPSDPTGPHKNVNFDIPDWRYLVNEFLIPGGGILQFVLFPLWLCNCCLVALPGVLRWRARHGRFIDNSVRTSRYNPLDFLPKQLLYQFSKIANLYFLFISCLQVVPGWSPTGRFTTIFPLAVFVIFAMCREAWDDVKRHRADGVENNTPVSRLVVEPISDSHQRRRKSHSSSDGQELSYMSDPRAHRQPLMQHPSTPAGRSGPPAMAQSASAAGAQAAILPSIEYSANIVVPLADGQRQARWETVKSRDLRVGDIILVRKDEMIPADVVVLATTNGNGVCFIETANLDGETNLKQKTAVKASTDRIVDLATLAEYRALIQAESPTDNLYGFDGYMELGHSGSGARHPLTPGQLLLRGSTLRNTHHVFAVVVYTGEDTKIRMNATEPRTKSSTVEQTTNSVVISVFVLVLILSGAWTALAAWWDANDRPKHWYISGLQKDDVAAFFSYVVLYNAFVPISLYVTLEVAKVVQILFMNVDVGMYDPVTDTPALARTSSLNEELGQVQYLFSDKTGTLTENKMVFRKLAVCGHPYFHTNPEHPQPPPSAVPENPKMADKPVEDLLRVLANHLMNDGNELQVTVARMTAMASATTDPNQTVILERTFRFFEALALCHAVVPDRSKIDKLPAPQPPQVTDGMIVYQSSSPDEVALSDAAREMGFVLRDRSLNGVSLSIFGSRPADYEVLQTLEFNSTRKRMSVVYRLPDGRIVLLCKGADSVIFERLTQSARAGYERIFQERTVEHLSRFASDGLRTLCYAYREFDEREYAMWSARYQEAATALTGRSKKLDAVAAEVERDLILLGATAIEDKLQEGVPATIDALRRAGVRVWMLTGDKKETAVNIAGTCELVKPYSEVIHIEGSTTGEIARSVERGIARAAEVQKREGGGHVVVVCEGETLLTLETQHEGYKSGLGAGAKIRTGPKVGSPFWGGGDDDRRGGSTSAVGGSSGAMNRFERQPSGVEGMTHPNNDGPTDYSLLLRFLDFGIRSDGVVCCRFSPAQKALVVTEVKNRVLEDQERLAHGSGVASLLDPNHMEQTKSLWRKMVGNMFRRSYPSGVTLAIGDGANDIPMIQSAHVGIGITGREGLAAARASDYSIAQFRFLQPLMFVHGRWAYNRVSLFTLATFYKCIGFYGTQALFQPWTGFSGTSLHESWTLALYNILFSSLPVIAVGIFEKDLSRSTLLGAPELYAYGQRSRGFNFVVFYTWVGQALWHAIVALGVPFILFNGLRDPSGAPGGGLVTTGVAGTIAGNVTTKAGWEGVLGGSAIDYTASTIRRTVANTGLGWWIPDSIGEVVYADVIGIREENFIYAMGHISYAIIVFIVTIKIAYMTCRTVTAWHHLAAIGTIAVWFVYPEIYNRLYPYFFEFGTDTAGMWVVFRGYFWVLYLGCILLGTWIALGLGDYLLNVGDALWQPVDPVPRSRRRKVDEERGGAKNEGWGEAGVVRRAIAEERVRKGVGAYGVAVRASEEAVRWWRGVGSVGQEDWAKGVRWWQEWEERVGVKADLGTEGGEKPTWF